MEKKFELLWSYKIILLGFASLAVMMSSSCVGNHIKLDTIVIVTGNLFIAFIVTKYLTKRQKKDEIALDHAIKDIIELITLSKEIKEDIHAYINKIKKPDDKTTNITETSKYIKKEFMSKLSLLEQSVEMLTEHKLINHEDVQKIQEIYTVLEENITGTATISDDWFDTHLKLQRNFLILKNNVSKKFRD